MFRGPDRHLALGGSGRTVQSVPRPATASVCAVGTRGQRSRHLAELTGQGTVILFAIGTGNVLGTLTSPPARSAGEASWAATTITAGPRRDELVTAASSSSVVRWRLDPATPPHAPPPTAISGRNGDARAGLTRLPPLIRRDTPSV